MLNSEVIEKVQKLLALTQSSNANEAAVAAAAADRLIAKYRLSQVDLELTGSLSESIEEDVDYIYETGRTTPWKVSLLGILVAHYGLAHFNDNYFPQGRKVSRFRLIGRKSDMAYAKYMFAWLVSECQRFADTEAKGKGYGRVYVESFCQGFVNGIAKQLQANKQVAEQDSSSAALVKLNARGEEAKVWMDHHHNLVYGKSKSYTRVDQFGLERGLSRGENFHLGPVMGNGATPLLNK